MPRNSQDIRYIINAYARDSTGEFSLLEHKSEIPRLFNTAKDFEPWYIPYTVYNI